MEREMTPYWYCLVRARPIPETEEQVNVGIIIGNGAPIDMFFVPGLPRLAGLVPMAMRRVFEEMLVALRAHLQEEDGSESLSKVGSQLNVGPRRALFVNPDKSVIAALRMRYLAGAKDKPLALSKEPHDRDLDALAGIISASAAIGTQALRSATPGKLYGDGADKIFDVSIPAVSWAVRAPKRDWLIDGVRIEEGKVDIAVRNATARVDRMFWHYKEARDRIRSVAGRETVTVGVILNGALGEHSNEALDAKRYIEHIWQLHASHVIDESIDPGLGSLSRLMSLFSV